LNVPEWAQSLDFPLVAVIAAVLAVLLPLLVWYLLGQSYKNRLAKIMLTVQEQKNALENQTLLLMQELQQSKNQQSLQLNTHEKESQRITLDSRRLQQTVTDQERQLGQLSQQANELYDLKEEYNLLKREYLDLQNRFFALQASFDSQKAAIAQERIGFDEKFDLLSNAEKHLNTQFENLANKIFEQKAEKFTKTSEHGINHLLSPLKQQIDDFKKQIRDQYVTEGQERASLRTEILGLKELNLQITQEAAALTNALKGDNKQQGNWGEIVLSRILDESGQREWQENEIQKHIDSDD
jgi:DNA recombination protein RmuC